MGEAGGCNRVRLVALLDGWTQKTYSRRPLFSGFLDLSMAPPICSIQMTFLLIYFVFIFNVLMGKLHILALNSLTEASCRRKIEFMLIRKTYVTKTSNVIIDGRDLIFTRI